jgi:anti-anti-sigma factor
MDLRTLDSGDNTVVELTGTLDAKTAAKFTAAVSQLVASGRSRLVLSFREVERVDSNGVRGLLLVLKRVRATGGALVLCELPAQVASAFEFAGLAKSFSVVPNRDKALREIGVEVQKALTGGHRVDVAVEPSEELPSEETQLSSNELLALELFRQIEGPAYEDGE